MGKGNLQHASTGSLSFADTIRQPVSLGSMSAKPARPPHTTMPVQARALYRKSALYQARNMSTNICIVSAPILFCILLLLIQTGMSKLMSGTEYQVSAWAAQQVLQAALLRHGLPCHQSYHAVLVMLTC